MSNRARIAIVAGAIVLVVVAFVLVNGSDKADTPTVAKTTATTPQTGATDTTATATVPKADIPVIATHDGKPDDDVQRLSFKQGDKVRFTVTSNIAEEVHVHGYDIAKNVSANGRVTFSFDASIEGIFEVELEHAGVQIAELEVNPS